MIKNLQGTSCDVYDCLSFPIVAKLSIANRIESHQNFTDDKTDLSFLIIGVFLIVFMGSIYSCFSGWKEKEIDKKVVSPSDFTVEYHNIPKEASKEEIQRYFEENSIEGKKNTKIMKVVMAYRITDYIKQTQLRVVLLRKKLKLQKKNKQSELSKVESDLKKVEDNLKTFEEKVKNGLKDDFTGVAFVSYASQKQARLATENFKLWIGFYRFSYLMPSCLKIGKKFVHNDQTKIIYGKRAPEPSDINWEQIGVSLPVRTFWHLVTFIGSLFLVGVSFCIILVLQTLQQDIKEDQTSYLSVNTGISFIISFSISLINSILSFLLRFLVSKQSFMTKSNFVIFLAMRLTYSMMVNTALVVFFSNIYLLYEKFETEEQRTISIINSGGLVYDVFYVLLFTIVIPPLFNFFNIFYLIRLIMRFLICFNKKSYLQHQANSWFEGHPIDMSYRYANILKTVLVATFFTTLFPPALIICLVSIIIQVAMDKFLMVTRHSNTAEFSSSLNNRVLGFGDEIILAFVVFLSFFISSFLVWALLCRVISL